MVEFCLDHMFSLYLALGNLPEDGIIKQRNPGYLHELLVAEFGVDSAQLGGGSEEEHFSERCDHGAQILHRVLCVVDEGRGPERGKADGWLHKPYGQGESSSGELGRCNVCQ